MKHFLIAVTLLAASLSTADAAQLIYDGSAADGARTSRSADQGLAGQFRVSETVELTRFGMNADLQTAAGNFNFVVFEGNTLVYQSGSRPVTDAGYTEFLSPVFSLLMTTGNSYFIGVIADISVQYGCCGGGGTQGSVTSIAANSNPFDFDMPTNTGLAGAHIDVNLYSGSAAVPLPASLPLLASALAGLGFLGRRRRA